MKRHIPAAAGGAGVGAGTLPFSFGASISEVMIGWLEAEGESAAEDGLQEEEW